MDHTRYIRGFILILLLSLLSACSDSNDGNSQGTDTPKTAQGLFLDAAVEGLSFLSGNQSGLTDAQGTFSYEEGASVQFFIGGIVIGEAIAKSVMTPIDLVEGASDEFDPTVTNIARFLQTLDNDANPDNGITVRDEVRTAAAGMSLNFDREIIDFENDNNVKTVVFDLTSLTSAGDRPLVSSLKAQSHLSSVLLIRRMKFTAPSSNTNTPGANATADVGLWMFKRDEKSFNAIADWSGKEYQIFANKRILEPINVLWVDFTSTTKQEATDKVYAFMTESGQFIIETPLIFNIPTHTWGYFAFSSEVNGIEQCCDPSHNWTWVDVKHPAENNHGRIFPAIQATSSIGDQVFITSGAFSREGAYNIILNPPIGQGHDFISFNEARDVINVQGGWKVEAMIRAGNEYSLTELLPYTTVDHDGIRVFGLYSIDTTGTTPWVGNWVQVNFLSDDDGGVWDADDESSEGIGFVVTVTETQWIETDNFGNSGGCTVTYNLSVESNNRYLKVPAAVGQNCPFTLDQLLFLHNIFPETGILEFSDGNSFMIDNFDFNPLDDDPDCCLVAFKYRRQ